MDKTLVVLNELVTEGVMDRYAIGGAMAATFYAEPVSTFDLDIFVSLPSTSGGLITLAPLYDALRARGYLESGEFVAIEGVPVQFIPPYNDLVHEALQCAHDTSYNSVPTRVLGAEFLIAIALQTGREKDRQRVALLKSQAHLNMASLHEIVLRHALSERWNEWTR
ncbi:MAG: hypothetical protein HUU46_00110 [Candidatus Hydrogenedentes bacterium]|nr:hypothetical protein [Candidatus Hydrogenedentota bacterium]